MPQAYTFDGKTLTIRRQLTPLDLFVKDFLTLLKRHAEYVVVSGFVSIATGRTRGTEDVDVIVPLMNERQFGAFFHDVITNGFWCYQGDTPNIVYPYIKEFLSVRFARKNEMFPNIEFISFNATKKEKVREFNDRILLKVRDFTLNIPPLEFEIIYKEKVLGSKKDKEDASHLRALFSDILENDKFKEYAVLLQHL